MKRRFKQIDVFGRRNFAGNPVAVILDAAGLSSREMAAISRWTNLSETTFVLPPERGGDYRLRIFTPEQEQSNRETRRGTIPPTEGCFACISSISLWRLKAASAGFRLMPFPISDFNARAQRRNEDGDL